MAAQLGDPARQNPDPETLNQLQSHPLRKAIQHWTARLPLAGDRPAFAWFVLQSAGLQIARHPEAEGGEKTIGENYAWRAYFHGGERDRERSWRASQGQHLRGSHLSPPFLTEFTDEWVIVISTPIHERPAGQGEFLGVLGLMIRVGSFAELPGNAQPSHRRSQRREALPSWSIRGRSTPGKSSSIRSMAIWKTSPPR